MDTPTPAPAPQEPSPPTPSSEAAKALSSLGAAKGGRARNNVLTPEQRSEIARQAVRARWMKAGKLRELEEGDAPPPPSGPGGQQGAQGPSRPYSLFRGTVMLGNTTLECHVLNDFRRVVTQREVVRAISGGRDSGNLGRYLERNPLTANGQFAAGPVIEFDIPGPPALIGFGYEATLLVEICDKYMEALVRGLLKPSQHKLAAQASIIIRSCAKVGIIALIDEATGFQKHRKKNALQLKLQAFIADDIQEWARMFPEEFWFELARLESVRYSPRSRPLRWGKYVMMFVYDAIDGDVGKELRKKNPNPRFLSNHHQWLRQFGRDKVHDQITKVVTIMKLCTDMDDFKKKFARVFKKTGQQPGLFDDMDWNLGETA